MRSRNQSGLDADLSDLVGLAAVGALAVVENAVADDALRVRFHCGLDVVLFELLAQRLDRLVAQGVHQSGAFVLGGGEDVPVAGGRELVDRRQYVLRQLWGLVGALLLADLGHHLLLEGDDLCVRLLGQLHRLEQGRFGDFAGAGLDHDDRVLGAGDDDVEDALIALLVGGIDDVLAVDLADARAGDGPPERDVGDAERGGGADYGHEVGVVLLVGGECRDHDLDVVAHALGEGRPQRPVGEAHRQGAFAAGPAFAAEEAAGDLAGGVHALLEIDR